MKIVIIKCLFNQIYNYNISIIIKYKLNLNYKQYDIDHLIFAHCEKKKKCNKLIALL